MQGGPYTGCRVVGKLPGKQGARIAAQQGGVKVVDPHEVLAADLPPWIGPHKRIFSQTAHGQKKQVQHLLRIWCKVWSTSVEDLLYLLTSDNSKTAGSLILGFTRPPEQDRLRRVRKDTPLVFLVT